MVAEKRQICKSLPHCLLHSLRIYRRLKVRWSKNWLTYLVDFLFEALLQHLVGFIEHDCLNAAEVDVASLDVIENSSARSHEEIDSTSEGSGLVVDGNTSVDSQRLEFLRVVLQSCKLVLHLY